MENPGIGWSSASKLWWWLRWRFMLLALAFMFGFLAFRLGAGVTDRPAVAGADLLTHVYYTLGLFVLGGMDLGVPEGGPDAARWLLWAAYFMCPAITLSAVIEGIVRAINPEAWALRRVRDHIVIGGGGALTRLYVSKLREIAPKAAVVIVESSSELIDRAEVRTQFGGAHIVHGDISSQTVLDSLNLGRARRLVLLTGNDFTNMEAASKVSEQHPDLATRTVLHVSDITMLRLLERSTVLQSSHIFNSHRIAAGHLVRTRLLAHFQATEPADLVVIAGFGRFGQTILSELQEHATGAFKTVIIIDRRAVYHEAVFEEQVGFTHTYRREVIQGDIADPSVWEKAESLFDKEITEPVFVLGSSDDGNNIRVALWLTTKYPEAYTVALSFRQSTFADQISHAFDFDVVSAEDLMVRSMPAGWFRGRKLTKADAETLLASTEGSTEDEIAS